MEHFDRETMESLGYFYLTIGMVPRSWVEKEINPEQFRGPDVVWWMDTEPAIDIHSYCDSNWSRADPTGWYLRDDVEEISWSDQDNHRVEIVLDGHDRLIDFTVSIDIRGAFSGFVDQLIEMARAAECTFFDFEDREIVEPSRQWVLQKIQQHEMNHVVFDSSGKLAPN